MIITRIHHYFEMNLKLVLSSQRQWVNMSPLNNQTTGACMNRLIFDEEHEMFRDSVRRFMQTEIGPHIETWREQGICDPQAFRKAGEQGLLCMWVDEAYGGAGISDFRFEQVVIEETIRHGDIGLFLSLHSRLVGPYIGDLGSEA